MSIIARQSTARTVMVGPILDADGVAVTGAAVSALKISKNGGVPAALNGSATLTHRHTGHYSLALTTSDTDTVGGAQVVIDDTVNAMPKQDITIVEEAVYDALFAASALGYVANAQVNVAQISGDSTAADNLEAMLDGTGGVTLSATLSDLESTVADSVPADGSRPSLKQAAYLITQFLTERAVSSTTLTVRKPDGSTTLMTFTLDDPTNPTSITRAS